MPGAEPALFVAGGAVMLAVPAVTLPAPRQEGPGGTADRVAVDLLRGGLLLAYGAAWAWGAARRPPHRELAVALGTVSALTGATSTAGRGAPLAAALLGAVFLAVVILGSRILWPGGVPKGPRQDVSGSR